jgi:hypothetical protein
MEASTAPAWGISIFGLLVIAGFVGLVLLLISQKRWIGLAMILTILAGLVSMKFYAISGPPPQVTLAYPVENQNANTSGNTQTDPTLEALWDKLTEAQIKLDDEPGYKPELIDKEGKLAIANTFGLGEEDSVPPPWVLSPIKSVGSVYRSRVSSDPFVTEAECRRQLEQELLPQAVSNRLEILLPSKLRRKVEVDDPAHFGINTDFILRDICVDEFTTTVDTSVGPMKKVYVLLEFDKYADAELMNKWVAHEQSFRLMRLVKIGGLSLAGLVLAWGLLRFDTYSRGYYSKQLLVGSVLAIIAVGVYLLRT